MFHVLALLSRLTLDTFERLCAIYFHEMFLYHSLVSRGLEWFSLSTLLTFAHSSSGVAKSEIQMIDVRTGNFECSSKGQGDKFAFEG